MSTIVISLGVIILFLLLFLTVFMTKTIPFMSKRINLKVNFFLIGIYLALLIVLSLNCFFLPRKALVKSISSSKLNDGIYWTFDKKASKGDYSAPDGFAKVEKIFPAHGTNVSILAVNYDAYIVTKTKGIDVPDNHDGKIDVYCFTLMKSIFNSLAHISNPQTPTIAYSKNQITIKSTRHTFEVYGFNDAISAQQFFTQGADNWANLLPKGSPNAVVVTIPRGITVTETGTSFTAK